MASVPEAAADNSSARQVAGAAGLRVGCWRNGRRQQWALVMTSESRVSLSNSVAFVESHGVVLESARGPIANLAEAIAGETVDGSWWGHQKGHQIFAATRVVRASPDVLVCRLVDGKVTYIHRRLWPAIVRLANTLDTGRLTAINEQHSESGEHQVNETPFPQWVPADVKVTATRLTKQDALAQLGAQVSTYLFEAE